jgi:prepilin-type processing-associated H-X9-DG protein
LREGAREETNVPIEVRSDDGREVLTPRRRLSPLMRTLIGCAGCGVFLLFAAAVIEAGVHIFLEAPKLAARRTVCVSNLKQLSTGLLMYAQDYDERMPPAATWSDNLPPYVKASGIYLCPSRRTAGAGYAFNRKLSMRLQRDIAAAASAPALFESSLQVPNASDTLESFFTPHDGYGNVGFADGHVKALTAAPAAESGLRKPGKSGARAPAAH